MRRLFKFTGILVLALLALALSAPLLIDVERFKPTLESELSTALNREVKLGKLKLSLLAGEVTADDLSIAEDQAFGRPAFIRAKSLAVGAQIWPFLISRKLVVTYLTVDQPEIALVQTPAGNWNFSSLGAAKAPAKAPQPGTTPLNLEVKLVKITNGRVSLGRTQGRWKPLALDQVNLELREFSAQSAFPFALSARVVGGGTLKLNGQAGPISPTDAAMTPVNASLDIEQLDLARSGMNDFAPDLGGLVSLNGSGSSDGTLLHLQGKLRAEKLKLAKQGTPAARPVEFDFAASHDFRKHSGALQRGDIHIGGATAHLTGTYAEQGEAMLLKMKLSGPSMPVGELEAMLPALAIVLPAGTRLQGGTASVALTMEGPADRLVTTGSLAVNKTRLTGFDLPKRMATIERLAGIKSGPDTEIETLSASVRVAPEGAAAQDMKLSVPAIGQVTGAGAISPANELDFNMSATVHTSGLLRVVSDTPIPFTVQGTCSDPVFRPDVKAVVKEKAKSAAGEWVRGLLGGKK
jgi:AsmA protein